jgi:hypothetical protein
VALPPYLSGREFGQRLLRAMGLSDRSITLDDQARADPNR